MNNECYCVFGELHTYMNCIFNPTTSFATDKGVLHIVHIRIGGNQFVLFHFWLIVDKLKDPNVHISYVALSSFCFLQILVQ